MAMTNSSTNNEKFCACIVPLPLKDGWKFLREELEEYIHEPSREELSDCMYAFGRMIAGIFGGVYIPMPGDKRHIVKMTKRMAQHGCTRSERHLINGRCPSKT